MRRTTIPRAVTGLLIVISTGVVFCTLGCDSQEELQLSQKQNQELTRHVAELQRHLQDSQQRNQLYAQRVAELEDQLKQAEYQLSQATIQSQPMGDVSTAMTTSGAVTVGSTYEVAEGDSLWKIAEAQLGDGLRYGEILALNPRIKNQDSLTIGERLNLPSK